MPALLTTTFCSVDDVQSYLSDEGVNLRLNDTEASGQYIQATAAAAINATSISIMPLEYAVNAGDNLYFSSANMTSQAPVVVTAPAATGATLLTVAPLTVAINAFAVAIDGGVNTYDMKRLTVQAIMWATAQVKLYCNVKYDDVALADSWSVNRWATHLAGYRLCRRRTNACPTTVAEDYKETVAELKSVQAGSLYIEDIGLRTTEAPAWSNVTVDQSGYDIRKVRVQRPISEGTPTQYPQNVSWPAEFSFEI